MICRAWIQNNCWFFVIDLAAQHFTDFVLCIFQIAITGIWISSASDYTTRLTVLVSLLLTTSSVSQICSFMILALSMFPALVFPLFLLLFAPLDQQSFLLWPLFSHLLQLPVNLCEVVESLVRVVLFPLLPYGCFHFVFWPETIKAWLGSIV